MRASDKKREARYILDVAVRSSAMSRQNMNSRVSSIRYGIDIRGLVGTETLFASHRGRRLNALSEDQGYRLPPGYCMSRLCSEQVSTSRATGRCGSRSIHPKYTVVVRKGVQRPEC